MDLFKALEMQRIECQSLSDTHKRTMEENYEMKRLFDETMIENRKLLMLLKEQKDKNYEVKDDLKRLVRVKELIEGKSLKMRN